MLVGAHLKRSEKSHVIAESVGRKALPAQHGHALLRGLRGQHERLSVCQRAGDGEDGIQTLQNHSTQNHLPQMRLHGQVRQMKAQLGQVLPGVHGIDGLRGSKADRNEDLTLVKHDDLGFQYDSKETSTLVGLNTVT